MDLKSYNALFIVATLVLTLVAAYPVIAIVMPFQGDSEQFSEFWLLGPDHIAENYPFNVSADEMYTIFVDLANHMGCSEYYLVNVKFRSITQSIPELANSQPSSLTTLHEFQFVVDAENVWESTVNFGFQDVSIEGDITNVGNVIINGKVFPVDASTRWDFENSGFYFQLFFELWHYDVALKSFRFDNQFVGIWLNMTGS